MKKKIIFIALRDHYANGVRLLANVCLQQGYDAHIIVFKTFDDGKPRLVTRKEWNLLRGELRKLNPEIIGTSFTSLPLAGITPKKMVQFSEKNMSWSPVNLRRFRPHV